MNAQLLPLPRCRPGSCASPHGLPQAHAGAAAAHAASPAAWLPPLPALLCCPSAQVYDVSSYVDHHPGGDAIFTHAGDDCTEGFHGIQHPPTVFDVSWQHVGGPTIGPGSSVVGSSDAAHAAYGFGPHGYNWPAEMGLPRALFGSGSAHLQSCPSSGLRP